MNTDLDKQVESRATEAIAKLAKDPLKLANLFWPKVTFYKQQRQIIESVWENDETYAPAGNMLGKDFVGGFIAIAGFLTRHPCRIVTTSATDDHLRVLWGEIGRYITSCRYPLDHKSGGPLLINHQNIRKIVCGSKCDLSYLTGMVAAEDRIAAMQGHHIANMGDGIWRTMFMCDESSSVMDSYYKMASTWANRMFIFGNPWPCTNFFFRHVEEGDRIDPHKLARYYRRIIKIRGEDSPNVRLALLQMARGEVPTGEMLVPGVKSWSEYQKNRELWDEYQQCVSLDAEFYKGKQLYLYPSDWLNLSNRKASKLSPKRRGRALGIDTAEGGDDSVWTIVDDLGVIKQVSKKTPNTNDIIGQTLALMREFRVDAENVVFDQGGGGLEHADRLRAMGHNVRTVAFGEAASSIDVFARGRIRSLVSRIQEKENRYAYKNRRAEMYGILRQLLEPVEDESGNPVSNFAIPVEYQELRRQLSAMPLRYTEDGRLFLPPKNRPPGSKSKEQTIHDLIGCSPDEADSLVLATFGMLVKPTIPTAGVF